MSIISISRGSFSRGKEVAQAVAKELGYGCLARDALLEASDAYDVEALKLTHAIEDPPSVLDRLTGGKARYIAYIRAVLLKDLLADNIVYHGLAGHFFLQGVSHALKVRVIADLEDRVTLLADRDGVSDAEAQRMIHVGDRGRRLWGLRIYGIDPEDPGLYDLVIHVGRVGVEGAAEVICGMVRQPTFQPSIASQAALKDLALAAAFEAMLVDMHVRVDGDVTAEDGEVRVRVRRPRWIHGGSYSGFRERYLDEIEHSLRTSAMDLDGLKSLDVLLDD